MQIKTNSNSFTKNENSSQYFRKYFSTLYHSRKTKKIAATALLALSACTTSLEYWLSTTHPPDNALLLTEKEKHPDKDLVSLMDHMAELYPHGAEGRAA